MFVLGFLSVILFLGLLFLAYCLLGFSQELSNKCKRSVALAFGKGARMSTTHRHAQNWFSKAVSGTVNMENSVEAIAGGNLGHSSHSDIAAPLYHSNSEIYGVIYTYTATRSMIEPYFQYTHVPRNARLGIGRTTATCGSAVLGSYTRSSYISLTERAKYGEAGDGLLGEQPCGTS